MPGAAEPAGDEGRRLLATALTRPAPDLAEALSNPSVTVLERPTSSLRRYRVFVADVPREQRNQLVVAAAAEGEEGRLLTGEPGQLAGLLEVDGGEITTAEAAADWLSLLIEARRTQPRLYALVTSPAELPWQPRLDEDDKSLRVEVEERLGPQLHVPVVTAGADGSFVVQCFVVDGSDLVHLRGTVSRAGRIDLDTEPVALDLPFIYVM